MPFYNMSASKYFVLMGLLTHILTTAARKINMKINLGGNAVNGFSAEEEFLQMGEEAVKTRFHGKIKGSGDDLQVFETQRFAREEDLVINVPVPDGIYAVTLMFAETWDGAFAPDKRVFDVYLGSKPGGVVKVAENFDPFRSGGPGGPVRQKYYGIATLDGLTVALRPIKQNPQIAGLVISGFSYSEPLLDELPTVPGDPAEMEDFSVLNNIGPRLPADPSLLYDPSLNPKLHDNKGTLAGGPSLLISPHQTTMPMTGSFAPTEQRLFGSQGPASRPGASLPSSVDSYAQKAPLSPVAQQGYAHNSFSGRTAPQILTSPASSPRLNLRVGTVHAEIGNAAPPQLSFDENYNPTPNHESQVLNPLSSVNSSLRRHGRRLASIPAEIDEKSTLTKRDSTQPNTPDLSIFASSSTDHPSSEFSPGLQQGSSAPQHQDYSTGIHIAQKNNQQAFDDGRTTGHASPMDSGTSTGPGQHDLRTGGTKIDEQAQDHADRTDRARVHYQAQAESISSPLSLQTKDKSQLAYLNSISQSPSATELMVDPGKPMRYESSQRRHPQNHISDFSGIRELGGQLLQSQGDRRASTLTSSQLHEPQSQKELYTETENTRQRNAMRPSLHMGVSSSQVNENGRIGDSDARNSASGDNGYGVMEGTAYQRVFNGRESSRDRRKTHSETLTVPDPVHSNSRTPSAGSPFIGTTGDMESSTLSTPKMSIERRNALSNDMLTTIDKDNTDHSESTSQRVKTSLGTNEVARSIPGSQTTETGANENYQAVSDQPVGSMSGEPLSENEAFSDLPNTDPRAEPIISLNVPAPGVHNGNGKLDGLCLDNSTHCSCGMVEQMEETQEECLFVVDENTNPMVCITRPCSGKLICACAPGASTLCQRSMVKSILVRASSMTPEGIGDPTAVACRRQTLERGVMVLSPVM